MRYADLLRERLIHCNYTSFNATQGRLRFENIYKPNENIRIGGLMRWKQHGGEWLFKCFVDGIALFKPTDMWKFNHPTNQSIKEEIYHYYKRVKVIVNNEGENVEVLQYKLLPQTAKYLLLGDSFSAFLAQKYNSKGGS